MAPTDSSCLLHPDQELVTITSCISTPGGYRVILTWSCPKGGYEAFELQVGRQRGSWDGPSCRTDVSVSGLQPVQSYSTTVTTVWVTMGAPSASGTCYTEPQGTERVSLDAIGPCCEGDSPTHGIFLCVCVVFFLLSLKQLY